jgi:hypothetical protein
VRAGDDPRPRLMVKGPPFVAARSGADQVAREPIGSHAGRPQASTSPQ